MKRFVRTLLVAVALGVLAPWRLAAQCPDGAPPPCAGARRAALRHTPPAAAARARSFLLLPFRNVTRTEDRAWLVSGAPLMLADGLGQIREVRVVDEPQYVAARRRLGIATGAELDAAQLRRLAEETGGWTAVTGNIIATGGRLRITAQASDAVTGQVLARGDADIPADADVRAAFDRIGAQLLAASGLPVATTDLASMTTRSLDAYRAYVRGMDQMGQSAFRRANASFREAIRLDSTFALAWARLAFTAGAWNVQAMFDPRSDAYTAVERAVGLASRLSPSQAQLLRALRSWFHGQFGRANLSIDSLLLADPDNLDAAELGAMFELLNPSIDTTTSPPRFRASLNRSITLARSVIDRDPGRRYVYAALAYAYGIAGGLWFGGFPGTRREIPTYGALALMPTEDYIPALRDSFVMMPAADFNALPASEQRQLRGRATDAGAAWMQRWLTAGPGDADAHLWASRFLDLQDSLPQSLREATIADSLGVETGLESVVGRRLTLLMRLGRLADAGAIADSLAAAHALDARPFAPALDNSRNFAIAALLATGRLRRASAVATSAAALTRAEPACRTLLDLPITTRVRLPDQVVAAMRDTLTAHATEIAADPVLGPCAGQLQSLGR